VGATLIFLVCFDWQTCAELEQQKKSHELQVKELNVVIQLLYSDKDQLEQQVYYLVKSLL